MNAAASHGDASAEEDEGEETLKAETFRRSVEDVIDVTDDADVDFGAAKDEDGAAEASPAAASRYPGDRAAAGGIPLSRHKKNAWRA